MRSMRVLALGGVLMLGSACSGRATRSEGGAGSAGSAGAASGGVASGGVASGGASGSAGTQNVAGYAGQVEPPLGCGYLPEGRAAEEGALATPDQVYRRISLFLAEEMLVPPPDLPASTTAAWAGDTAVALLDSFEQDGVAAPGLTRFLLGLMPDLEDPAMWGGLATSNVATMRDLLTFSPSAPWVGILTDPGFLRSETGIASRGAHMLEVLFCADVPAPPTDAPQLFDMPNTTRREEYMALVNDPSCAGCHLLFDPLGFSLEHFDELGMYVEIDDGLPIDSSGSYVTPGGAGLNFADINELAPQLVMCEVAECWSTRLLSLALQLAEVPVEGSPNEDSNRVANRFGAEDFRMRELIRAIVESPAFLRP